ncbi:hypothetical protein D3C77_526190 [compost metagenome]
MPRKGDSWAIAIAAKRIKAYVHNRLVMMSGPVIRHRTLKYHGLNGDCIVRGEYLLPPISFLASLLEARLVTICEGRAAEITLMDGRKFQFAHGSIGCVVNNKVQSMYCEAVYQAGELYIPIQWIFERHFNCHTSYCNDVLYITDHHVELSFYMAELIRDEIL